jgi:NAD(P)-dependent dehydrogenase (short-subunit alcohol dehydrogenase family)
MPDQGGDLAPHQVPGGGVGRGGITVNTVAPTFIHTPGTAPTLADPAFRADVEGRIAGLHRIASQWTWPARWCFWPPRPPR